MIWTNVFILTVVVALTSQIGFVEYKDELSDEEREKEKENEKEVATRLLKSNKRQRGRKRQNDTNSQISHRNYSFPASCADAAPRTSGPYLIKIPHSDLNQFFAYCEVDPDGGHAWTRIQHNTNGTRVIFDRDWKTYKHGFGDIANDHFIGLEKLHALTLSKPHELWIQIVDLKDVSHNFKYSIFAIGEEEQDYALNVLGTYSGLLRDSLRSHVGKQFATYDRDHEKCAKRHGGGWWFCGCFPTFLNGDRKPKRTGIVWYQEFGKLSYYKMSKMLIRPAPGHIHFR